MVPFDLAQDRLAHHERDRKFRLHSFTAFLNRIGIRVRKRGIA